MPLACYCWSYNSEGIENNVFQDQRKITYQRRTESINIVQFQYQMSARELGLQFFLFCFYSIQLILGQ